MKWSFGEICHDFFNISYLTFITYLNDNKINCAKKSYGLLVTQFDAELPEYALKNILVNGQLNLETTENHNYLLKCQAFSPYIILMGNV